MRNSEVNNVAHQHKIACTYLADVGRRWDGELLPMDVEGHIRHLGNRVTVDNILRAQGKRENKARREKRGERKG